MEAHCTESALVVKYEIEAVPNKSDSAESAVRTKKCQKIIRLKDLNENVDIGGLATHILKLVPAIPEDRQIELEQLLLFLQNRQCSLESDGTFATAENSESTVAMHACMADLDDYIEMLYEDVAEKTKAVALFLQLSRNVANLKCLIENETLIGALTRVFRDDWKKSFDLSINIVCFFLAFTGYREFHSIIAHHKIGALCMQVIDYELKRWEAWSEEARDSDDRTARKLTMAIRKQQQLISGCLNLLMDLADDPKVEVKIVNRKIVPILVKCIADRECINSLLTSAVNFLLKLSIFIENKSEMIAENVVGNVVRLFPTSSDALRKSAIRLLFNLSFDSALRDQMVTAGLLAHIAPLIDVSEDESALNLVYQLSINDDAKAMIAYTDLIQNLMRRMLSEDSTLLTVKAVLINIALEKRNAQLICGVDGQGLDVLLEMAISNEDQLLLKIVRNIAAHNGPTQNFLSKWASKLLELVISDESNGQLNPFALECLGTVNQLNSVNWSNLATQHSLIAWIERCLHSMELREYNSQLLQVIILCGVMARQLESARMVVNVTDRLVELLAALQEDDEMVVQIIYVFYGIITHEELGECVMGGSAQVGAYLIDLMHDRNAPIRSICDRALSIIAGRSEDWARKMDVERFRWHNAQWLEMIADGSNFVESAISDSPDVLNEVFGVEDILGDRLTGEAVSKMDANF